MTDGWMTLAIPLSSPNLKGTDLMVRVDRKWFAEQVFSARAMPERSRGWEVVLTNSGFAGLDRAWPAHPTSIRRNVIDHMEKLDLPPVIAAVSRFAADDRSGEDEP
jgi:hypothetical protein